MWNFLSFGVVVYVGWNGWMKFGTIGSLGGFGFVTWDGCHDVT